MVLLLAELAAEREELFATFTGANSYFQQKSIRERVKAFGSWVSHQIQKYLWGYGLQLRVLLRAAAIVVLGGALATWLMEISFDVPEGINRPLTFVEALLFAIGSFTTAATTDINPISVGGSLLVVFESLSGAVFLGLLAATAYRKIAR